MALTPHRKNFQNYPPPSIRTLAHLCPHASIHPYSYIRAHLCSQDLLEKFRPLEMDLFDIKDLLTVIEPFIKRLELNELLPPIVYTTSADIADEDEDEDDEDNLSTESKSKTTAAGDTGSFSKCAR